MTTPRRPLSLAIAAPVVALLAALAAAPAGAAPAAARGQQFFAITHQQCLDKATAAMQQAGYRIWGILGNGPWGDNGPHAASIICEPHSNSQEVVNIVVASDSQDGNVPARERDRL